VHLSHQLLLLIHFIYKTALASKGILKAWVKRSSSSRRLCNYPQSCVRLITSTSCCSHASLCFSLARAWLRRLMKTFHRKTSVQLYLIYDLMEREIRRLMSHAETRRDDVILLIVMFHSDSMRSEHVLSALWIISIRNGTDSSDSMVGKWSTLFEIGRFKTLKYTLSREDPIKIERPWEFRDDVIWQEKSHCETEWNQLNLKRLSKLLTV